MPPPSSTSTSASTPLTPSRVHPPSTVLLLYPATLVLGSLFSILSPTAQSPHTSAEASSTASRPHPVNYFARKDNIFNIYFVKIGWIWFTLAFVSILLSHPPSLARARRQAQGALRYLLVTTVWYATTQWFFGPAIIDRSFIITGGKCGALLQELSASQNQNGVLGATTEEPLSVYLTAAACKAAGGAWRGGHDVSGHVFMLVLVTAVLGFEGLGLRVLVQGESRTQTQTAELGSEMNGKKETSDVVSEPGVSTWTFRFVGVVVGLSWWMLLMTAIWFHTWLEKANGLLIALAAVYTLYILPRRLIPWRNVVGIPGV